ncbi:MAG: helicase C-terminal domain-containing protein [Candidatus Krumholzibacteriota bacterium]|nr:helicase C-terminal domain-containing protein [Candidatus Krumholzibacteriota bacterium]
MPGNDSISFRPRELEAFTPYLKSRDNVDFSSDELSKYILERLSRGIIPLPLLLTIAKRISFEGIRVIETAAAEAVKDVPGGIFNKFGIGEKEDAVSFSDKRFSLQEENSAVKNTEGFSVRAGRYSVKEAFELIFEELGEKRLDQLEMASEVMNTLKERKVSFIEAGTGTGKSLAYLIPAVLFSLETRNRIVVSTHTKNLQNQLFGREIELIRSILKLDFAVERLVGRENYICSRRLISAVSKLMEERPRKALALALYSVLSETHTLESLPSDKLGIDPFELGAPARCLMRGCGNALSCPLVIARERARAANIVFVNHALVMADYKRGGGVLGDYHGVVFDEAHHLDKCVMENLSVRITPGEIKGILKWIKPVTLNDDRWKFMLRKLETAPGVKGGEKLIFELQDMVSKTQSAWKDIFKGIERSLNREKIISGKKTRYYDGEETFIDIKDSISLFLLYNNKLRDTLKVLYKHNGSENIRHFKQELEAAESQLDELAAAAVFLTKGNDEDTVFWIEWNANSRVKSICGSPIDIDRRFADFLEESTESAVFTSATLSQNGSFDYMKKRLGVRFTSKPVFELVKPSSFFREDNCLVVLRSGLGNPNDRDFSVAIMDIVRELAVRHRRRLLVLFTSYKMCLVSAELLDREELPGPLLVQGRGESREVLSREFRKNEASVLLGVASFWEGVDFPGKQLEILVIPKIPFPVPDEPIIQARSERLRSMGGNPFQELFLPEAILRLKQGIGRLIRRKDDRGMIVILDSRIHNRSYGRHILSSLPTEGIVVSSGADVIGRSMDWFAE